MLYIWGTVRDKGVTSGILLCSRALSLLKEGKEERTWEGGWILVDISYNLLNICDKARVFSLLGWYSRIFILYFMDSGDPNFLSVLLSIGRELTDEDFENLKFLCEGTIPASHLETVKRPRELFLELIHCCDLSNDNKDPLSSLLFHIGRQDLRNLLLGVQG